MKFMLQYSQFNSFLQTRCCGSMSCCVGTCCRESSWLGCASCATYVCSPKAAKKKKALFLAADRRVAHQVQRNVEKDVNIIDIVQ